MASHSGGNIKLVVSPSDSYNGSVYTKGSSTIQNNVCFVIEPVRQYEEDGENRGFTYNASDVF